MRYLSVEEIAKDLGLSERTVQRYCNEGIIRSERTWIKNHFVHKIPANEYYDWKFRQKNNPASSIRTQADQLENLDHLVNDWLDWCRMGKLSGRPVGPRMIEIYEYYFGMYLKHLNKRELKQPMTLELARKVLGLFPPARFSTKLSIYSSLMSFGKYLIENKKLDEEYRTKLKTIRPRRFLPAKRTVLNEYQYRSLVKMIEGLKSIGGFRNYDKVLTKTLVVFIVNTGLRNAECCKLKIEDVNFDERKIYVKLGKGNKNRVVGMNDDTYNALVEYLKVRSKFQSEFVFLTKLGNQFKVETLAKKIRKVTTYLGFKDISPHSLRRTFATINSAKGKPLNHLRIALGHADLSTTQSYIMTTQDEVVEAMKGW